MNDAMASILKDKFDNPTQRFCAYTVNGAETGSATLNNTPQWDWTPAPSVGVRASTCSLPLALGCKPVLIDEQKEWIEPRITCPEDVSTLEIPDIYEGRTGHILKEFQAQVDQLDEGSFIKNPDIQSPLGVAELMWDSSFYIALIEEPGAVHALLDKITEFTIRYIQELQRIAGDRYNPCGFPPVWSCGPGTMVADDSLSLISPEMHAEFSVPYINRIGMAAGPLYYHSCTWRKAHFESIKQIENVRSYNWNPGNSDDPVDIFPEFSGRAVLALHLCKDMHRDHDVVQWGYDFPDEVAFFRHFLDVMEPDTCMYWWFSNVRNKGPILEAIYALLDERGFTPRAYGL